PSKGESSINYAALAAAARLGTLVLLMGVSHLPQITTQLLANGIHPDLPALCIEWGTTSRQRVVEGTLQTIAENVLKSGIQAPALTIFGDVVNLRAAGLQWFGQS